MRAADTIRSLTPGVNRTGRGVNRPLHRAGEVGISIGKTIAHVLRRDLERRLQEESTGAAGRRTLVEWTIPREMP